MMNKEQHLKWAILALSFAIAGCATSVEKQEPAPEQESAAVQPLPEEPAAVEPAPLSQVPENETPLRAEAEETLPQETRAESVESGAEQPALPPDTGAADAAGAREAIAEGRTAVSRAEAEGALWIEPARVLSAAETALKAGDITRAIELAVQARRQAENAIEQKRAERAKVVAGGIDRYEVIRGDNLWSIAGKAEIYANPYHWPLIFKANRDQIKDPDLIHPKQVFSINRNLSSADMVEAARHARNRGSWSVGKVESSDKSYLSR